MAEAEENIPKEHHGREYLVAGISVLGEYLAVRYGIGWLGWLSALFLWLAVISYGRKIKNKRLRFGLSVLFALIISGVTYCLVDLKVSEPVTSGQKVPSASEIADELAKRNAASPKVEKPSMAKKKPPNDKHLQQPQQPSIVINSPDPYVGISNQIVAQWARDEADRIEAMGKKCGQDVVVATQRKNQGIPTDPMNGFYGPEAIQVFFRREFDNCCRQAIIKLHDSITFRLGPAALDSLEESHHRGVIDFNDIPQRSWPLCMEVQGYSRDLRKMAERLLNR
jgi:hypothetical protein